MSLYAVMIGTFLEPEIAEDVRNDMKRRGFRFAEVVPVAEEHENEERRSDAEIACEVIRNRWGSESEQAERLDRAGYDYEAILRLVDRIRNS